jgi:hypothetical protein
MDTSGNDQNDDDGDFIAPSSDHSDFEETVTTAKKKDKGKGKAKETYGDDDLDMSFESSQNNPAVMLLSLKAVGRTPCCSIWFTNVNHRVPWD